MWLRCSTGLYTASTYPSQRCWWETDVPLKIETALFTSRLFKLTPRSTLKAVSIFKTQNPGNPLEPVKNKDSLQHRSPIIPTDNPKTRLSLFFMSSNPGIAGMPLKNWWHRLTSWRNYTTVHLSQIDELMIVAALHLAPKIIIQPSNSIPYNTHK